MTFHGVSFVHAVRDLLGVLQHVKPGNGEDFQGVALRGLGLQDHAALVGREVVPESIQAGRKETGGHLNAPGACLFWRWRRFRHGGLGAGRRFFFLGRYGGERWFRIGQFLLVLFHRGRRFRFFLPLQILHSHGDPFLRRFKIGGEIGDEDGPNEISDYDGGREHHPAFDPSLDGAWLFLFLFLFRLFGLGFLNCRGHHGGTAHLDFGIIRWRGFFLIVRLKHFQVVDGGEILEERVQARPGLIPTPAKGIHAVPGVIVAGVEDVFQVAPEIGVPRIVRAGVFAR